MENVIRKIQAEIPLSERVFFRRLDEEHADPVPQYLAIISSVLRKKTKRPICFVLPRSGDLPRLATIFYSLFEFSESFKDIANAYAQTQFKVGDRVRIKPTGEVFLFKGIDPAHPGQFRLAPLNESGHRTFPSSQILRIEKTKAARPPGKLATKLRSPENAAIDEILQTETYGNKNLFRNEILVLDEKEKFHRFTSGNTLQSSAQKHHGLSIKDMVPMGSVPNSPQSGGLSKWNPTDEGIPLIAVTHSVESLLSYCLSIEPFSKLIAVIGLSKLKANLQAYDDIALSQHLALFSDHNDEEGIKALKDRGCQFWYLSEARLISTGIPGTKTIRDITTWTSNHESFELEFHPCEDARIDEIFFDLNRIKLPENDPLQPLLSDVWRLFRAIYNTLGTLEEDSRSKLLSQIAELETSIDHNRQWIPLDTLQSLLKAKDNIQVYCRNHSSHVNSRETILKKTIQQQLDLSKTFAVIVSDEKIKLHISNWLRKHGFEAVPVFSIRTIPAEVFFQSLIFPFWLGASRLSQIAGKLISPSFIQIGYAFEGKWLQQSRHRIHTRNKVGELSNSQKSDLLFGSGSQIQWPNPDSSHLENGPAQTASPDMDVWDFEQYYIQGRIGSAARPATSTDTVPSRYIRFSGPFFAFLTEGHKVPIATGLLSGKTSSTSPSGIPERTISDIRVGDFLVFPESGNREFIQSIADALIGKKATEIRTLARTWKDALRSSQLSPEKFLSLSKGLNKPRHIMTIKRWFGENFQIGPRDKDDLILIELVTEDAVLREKVEEVWEAIEKLRSFHLRAGSRLHEILLTRLPEVLSKVDDGIMRIDMGGLGAANIVQVESIEDQPENRGYNEINRLLRAD